MWWNFMGESKKSKLLNQLCSISLVISNWHCSNCLNMKLRNIIQIFASTSASPPKIILESAILMQSISVWDSHALTHCDRCKKWQMQETCQREELTLGMHSVCTHLVLFMCKSICLLQEVSLLIRVSATVNY